MESQHKSYLIFIKRNQKFWGPFGNSLTRVHLTLLKFFDFLEKEPTYNETPLKLMIKYFFGILKKSSMHGTFHLTQLKRHPCEVFLWLFLLCLAGFFGLIIINVFWLRYYFNPMVISIERDYMNWNVTFPSLTLCETQKVNKTALHEYVSEVRVRDKKRLIQFIQDLANVTYYTTNTLLEYDDINPDDYVTILDRVTNKNEGQSVITGTNDSLYLQRVMTEMGMCYTFNSKIAEYMSPSYLLRNELTHISTEYTVNMFDMAKVAFVRDLSFCCEIYSHNPMDTPNSMKKLKLNGDQRMFTMLKFSATPIIASEAVRFLLINQRKCRFIDESNLKYFPIYSASLCQMECKIKAILQLCGCLPFFYKKAEDEQYCNVKGLKCVGTNLEKIKQITSECKCYSNCEDTKFTLEEINSAFWLTQSAIRWELSNTKTRLKRNVIFGYVDAFVGTGNVFNLFLGISVLSLVEAFYSYFIHLPLKYKNNRRN